MGSEVEVMNRSSDAIGLAVALAMAEANSSLVIWYSSYIEFPSPI